MTFRPRRGAPLLSRPGGRRKIPGGGFLLCPGDSRSLLRAESHRPFRAVPDPPRHHFHRRKAPQRHQNEILRLQVPVDHAPLVQDRDPVHQSFEHLCHLGHGQAPPARAATWCCCCCWCCWIRRRGPPGLLRSCSLRSGVGSCIRSSLRSDPSPPTPSSGRRRGWIRFSPQRGRRRGPRPRLPVFFQILRCAAVPRRTVPPKELG